MSLYWVLYFDRKLDVCLLFSGCIYFGQLVMQGEIIVLIEIGQVQSSHLLTIDAMRIKISKCYNPIFLFLLMVIPSILHMQRQWNTSSLLIWRQVRAQVSHPQRRMLTVVAT